MKSKPNSETLLLLANIVQFSRICYIKPNIIKLPESPKLTEPPQTVNLFLSSQVCLHSGSMALNFFCDTFACPIALYKSLSLQRKELWKNKWHKLSKQLTCQTKRHWITALINIPCVICSGFSPLLQHFDLWFFKHFITVLLDT